MLNLDAVVITGVGCVTPKGIGREAFLDGLMQGDSAIEQLYKLDDKSCTTFYGAKIPSFEGKQYVTPRKALKVMSREVQIAYAAAQLAWQDAFANENLPEPERIGVIYGSEMIHGSVEDSKGAVRACTHDGEFQPEEWGGNFGREIFPLWMLKNLPNMPACHVGIAVDARGPNNTIVQEEVSGLLAILEAESIIRRGDADVVIVGAIGSRVTPTRLCFRPHGLYNHHPAETNGADCSRPFSTQQHGITPGEGSAVLILESARHAAKRKANIIGQLHSITSHFGAPQTEYSGSSQAIASAIESAMSRAELAGSDLSHVSAQGLAHKQLDQMEAEAIQRTLPGVPVNAMSSYFGTAGAACGLMEIVGSLLCQQKGQVLPVQGIGQIAADCPVNVVKEMMPARGSCFLKTSYTPAGLAAAAVIECNAAANE